MKKTIIVWISLKKNPNWKVTWYKNFPIIYFWNFKNYFILKLKCVNEVKLKKTDILWILTYI